MLQATLSNSYRNKKGHKVYTYKVSGSPKEIAAYKAAQGDNLREDELGNPLFFLTENDPDGNKRLIDPQIDLTITTNNRVVVDDIRAEQALMKKVREHEAVEIAKARAQRWVTPQQARTIAVAPATQPEPAKLATPEEIIETINQEGVVPEGAETIGD